MQRFPRFNRPGLRGNASSALLGYVDGDGSTLTLDFTTGQLDPRLTFTRGSNATFINSSGLVQWADANIFYNSTWTDGNNTPTAWSVGSGTASRSGETRTFTTSASQVYITQTRNTSSGIRYTASVEVTAVTGTQRIDDVIVALGGSSYQYYFNGSTAAGSTTLTTGVVGVAFTAGAATTTLRVGSGVQGTNTTGAVTLRFPQFEPGSVALRIYRPNDSTTSSYEAPRFDYDPTTQTPRGLLIEGTATNLFFYSEDVTQASKWTIQTPYASISATGGTAPNNTNTGNLCTESTGSAARSIYQAISPAAGTYTTSVWAKAGSGSARFIRLVLSSAAGNFVYVTVNIATGAITQSATAVGTATAASALVTPHTGSWYRITLTGTLAAAANFMFIVPTDSGTASVNTSDYGRYTYTGDGSSFLIWGAQVEAGSGASSYIPTGASTVTRNADECSMTGTNFSSWFNASAGTLLVSARTATRYVDSAGFDFPAVLTLDSNNHIGPCQWNGVVYGVVRAGGSYRINYATLVSPGNNANYKAAIAYANSDYAGVANGGAIQTGSGTTVPSGLNQLALGTSRSGVAGNFFGHISQIKFWPTRLPNAQLQSLTT